MKQFRYGWLLLCSMVGISLLGMLALIRPAATASTVVITAPKSRAVIFGSVRISARLPQHFQMSYAMLAVDGKGSGVSNCLPLRFDLDTTTLSNGPHLLQVQVWDATGEMVTSAPTQILVANPEIAVDLPPPGTHKPQPVPVAKAATPAPAATEASTTAPVTTETVYMPVDAQVIDICGLAGNDEITLLLDRQHLAMPTAPFIMQNRTMVMLRPLVVAAGGAVNWDGKQAHAMRRHDRQWITFTPNSDLAKITGQQYVMNTPAVIRNGAMYVPVTIWRDLFGGWVEYNAEYRCVLLRSYEALVQAKIAK
jgi:hypothetical protein